MLSYAMHYCGKRGWLLLHLPWGAQLNRYSREVSQSAWKPARFDLPHVAADWLGYFRTLNLPLQQLDLRTTQEYVWNRREKAEEVSSLLEAIEFGLSRPKYASDVMGLILKEVKKQASD